VFGFCASIVSAVSRRNRKEKVRDGKLMCVVEVMFGL